MRQFEFYTPGAGCNGLISEKTNRNQQCPCGSGKKAKKCCGTKTRYKNREIITIPTDIEVQKRKVDGIKN